MCRSHPFSLIRRRTVSRSHPIRLRSFCAARARGSSLRSPWAWRLPGWRDWHCRQGSCQFPGRAVVFLALTLALGPGLLVNGLLKEHWSRPRPGEVVEFGGSLAPTPWDPRGRCEQNCSFVSGETSGAAWTVAPALLLPGTLRAVALGAAGVFTGRDRDFAHSVRWAFCERRDPRCADHPGADLGGLRLGVPYGLHARSIGPLVVSIPKFVTPPRPRDPELRN